MDGLPQDASRLAYTQRILEIVSNIKKQKEEITKVSQTGEGWVEAGLGGGRVGRMRSDNHPLADPDGHQASAEGDQRPDGEAGSHLRCDRRDGL